MNTRIEQPPGYTTGQARAVLVLMICITAALDFARQPIYFLIDPVRATFGMDDVQSSMLLGGAFALPLTVMSLVGGWLSDRGPRRMLVVSAMVCWTAGACLFATASGYAGLVAGRVLVGFGAGILVPVAMTWIGDAFVEEKRGKANGLFFIILSVGPAYSGAITGTLQKYAEAGVIGGGILSGMEPWRITLLLLALPSVIFIPAVFLLKDNRKSGTAHGVNQDKGGPRKTPPVMA
ncbi:MAG: MFS transporter [Pseudomonadota bacterium]